MDCCQTPEQEANKSALLAPSCTGIIQDICCKRRLVLFKYEIGPEYAVLLLSSPSPVLYQLYINIYKYSYT